MKRTAPPVTQSAGGRDPGSSDEWTRRKWDRWALDGDRTEPAWCPVTVHLQTGLAVNVALTWQSMPFSGPRLPGTQGPDRRGDHCMATPQSGLGHRDDLSGWRWARVGAAWRSQLLLVAVEGLDRRPWGLGATQKPPAPVLTAPAHSGIVPQEPALHSVPPEALSPHESLCSQVPLLAEGRQLLVC